VDLPDGAEVGSDGVRLPADRSQLATPPNAASSLRVHLPPLADGPFDLSFDLAFEESPRPPAFVAIALHDVSFVLLDSALDGRGERARSLHGLERGLHHVRRIGRAGIWVGELSEYPTRLAPPAEHVRIKAGRSITVRISSSGPGGDLTLRVGALPPYSLPRETKPGLTTGGLRIGAFPSARVSDLELTRARSGHDPGRAP